MKSFKESLAALGRAEKLIGESDAWVSKAQKWIGDYAGRAFKAEKAAHVKKGKSPNTYRYNPDEFHREFVKALGKGDEEAVKAMMMHPIQHDANKAAL